MRLWNDREVTATELLRHVGDVSQIARVDPVRYESGHADGLAAWQVETGSGLRFSVLAGRGMDIGTASFGAVPLAWRNGPTECHAHRFEPEKLGWLRSFAGGLVTTCGLTTLGSPGEAEDGPLPLHGRVSHLQAYHTGAWGEWVGDEYRLVCRGSVRESRLFGDNLELTRTVTAWMGGSTISIEDTVTNLGYRSSPLMILYHCNLGYPLVDAGAEILSPGQIEPRDADATLGIDDWSVMTSPQDTYPEQVFYHIMPSDPGGWTDVALMNRRLGLALSLRYRPDQLPHLVNWKNMAAGQYVVGLEPANTRVGGREAEMAAGRVQYIEPGEIRTFGLNLTVHSGETELIHLEQRLRSLAR